MKTARMLAVSAMLTAMAAIPAYAQVTRPAGATPRPTVSPATGKVPANVAVPNSKIALVNPEAFADQKAGIVRFAGALQTLQREVKPREDEMIAIQAKMQQLAKDLDTLSKAPVVNRTTIQSKQEEGKRLDRELKYKKEEYDALTPKRYRDIVGPVSRDIGIELDAFRRQHGITMVLDTTKLLPAILSVSDEMDITRPFIAYYNARHPATSAAPK